MERIISTITSYVIFAILSVILSQCNQSLAQPCTVSCTQTAIIRNKPYEEIFEIVQNRDWETEDDFGEDLLDLIRRQKRFKRQGKLLTILSSLDHTFPVHLL